MHAHDITEASRIPQLFARLGNWWWVLFMMAGFCAWVSAVLETTFTSFFALFYVCVRLEDFETWRILLSGRLCIPWQSISHSATLDPSGRLKFVFTSVYRGPIGISFVPIVLANPCCYQSIVLDALLLFVVLDLTPNIWGISNVASCGVIL